MAFKSCSAVLIGIRLNLSCSTFSTLGVTNAGNVGPNRMLRMPRCNRVRRIADAEIVLGANGKDRLENSSQALFHYGLHRLTSLFFEDGIQRQVRIQMMRLQP